MSDALTKEDGNKRRDILQSISTWMKENPVILKEMRSRMRGWRSLVLLTIFTGLLGGIVTLIYFSFNISNSAYYNVSIRKELGQAIFATIFGIELLAVCFVPPSLTAGAISSEREHQTYDLLRTTLLSAPALVVGKLVSALSFVLLMLFAALPLQSIAFLFGGITLVELILGSVILLLTAAGFGALGIFFSSFTNKTRVSTVLAQITTALIVFGLPLFLFFLIALLESPLNNTRLNIFQEITLLILGWSLVTTNPIATTIASEAALLDQGNLLYFSMPLRGGANFYLPSPWIGFTLVYLAATTLLIWISIKIVKRPER